MIKASESNRPAPARERILEAATSLFWRQGYHQVSTDAICRAAEVRKGSLYHAFPQKADVLAACFEAVFTRDWRELQTIYGRSGSAEAKFLAHLKWFAASQRRLKEQHGIVLGNFDMALGVSIPDPVFLAMRERQAMHRALLKTSIIEVLGLGPADDAHANWLTEVVAPLISGTMIRARTSNDLAPLEKLPDTILQLIHAVPHPPARSRVRRTARADRKTEGAVP